jgi:hypothetical protein
MNLRGVLNRVIGGIRVTRLCRHLDAGTSQAHAARHRGTIYPVDLGDTPSVSETVATTNLEGGWSILETWQARRTIQGINAGFVLEDTAHVQRCQDQTLQRRPRIPIRSDKVRSILSLAT